MTEMQTKPKKTTLELVYNFILDFYPEHVLKDAMFSFEPSPDDSSENVWLRLPRFFKDRTNPLAEGVSVAFPKAEANDSAVLAGVLPKVTKFNDELEKCTGFIDRNPGVLFGGAVIGGGGFESLTAIGNEILRDLGLDDRYSFGYGEFVMSDVLRAVDLQAVGTHPNTKLYYYNASHSELSGILLNAERRTAPLNECKIFIESIDSEDLSGSVPEQSVLLKLYNLYVVHRLVRKHVPQLEYIARLRIKEFEEGLVGGPSMKKFLSGSASLFSNLHAVKPVLHHLIEEVVALDSYCPVAVGEKAGSNNQIDVGSDVLPRLVKRGAGNVRLDVLSFEAGKLKHLTTVGSYRVTASLTHSSVVIDNVGEYLVVPTGTLLVLVE